MFTIFSSSLFAFLFSTHMWEVSKSQELFMQGRDKGRAAWTKTTLDKQSQDAGHGAAAVCQQSSQVQTSTRASAQEANI